MKVRDHEPRYAQINNDQRKGTTLLEPSVWSELQAL